MPAVQIEPSDLTPFAAIDPVKAAAMIEDALALAAQIAPCILEANFEHPGAAKAILRKAILRWNDAGTGAVVSNTAGPFGQTIDTSQSHRSLFWPTEITQLQKLCGGTNAGAFAIDTAGTPGLIHAEACSVVMGANYCDCGAVLTGLYPLWGE